MRLWHMPWREGFLDLDQRLHIQHLLFYQGNEKRVSNCTETTREKASLRHVWVSSIGIKTLLMSWLQFRLLWKEPLAEAGRREESCSCPAGIAHKVVHAGRCCWGLPALLKAGLPPALESFLFWICDVADKLPQLLMSCEIPNETGKEDVSLMSDSQRSHRFR